MRYPATLFNLIAVVLAASRSSRDASSPWEKYIYSPASRTYSGYSVNAKSDNVSVSSDRLGHVFKMPAGSSATFDWGVEVGGFVSFQITTEANSSQFSLAYNESPFFIRPISDDTGAVPTEDYDKAYNASVAPGTSYFIMPTNWFRGGFRFTTITAHDDITISNLTCEIRFDPNKANLRDYSGYFYTNDETLVKSWYAGAYTVQTNIAPQDTGRFLPQVKPGWDYNSSLGVGSTFLLDGAKRDRAVWPGDLGVSGTTCMLSMGESGWAALLGSLETVFAEQNATTGELPFAGPDTASYRGGSQSDTYHSWGLIAIYNYAIFTGNLTWVSYHWSNISRAVNFIVLNLDPTVGLQNQTQTNDWARQGGGGYNSALNALDYHVLDIFSSLATALGGSYSSSASTWSAAATKLKAAYNSVLWNSTVGLYNDNQTAAGALLHPQDGNSLALLYNLTETPAQASSISAALPKYWNTIGPVTPELPDTISPFVSGIEVLAHYAAGDATTALKLIRQLWGYLLTAPQFTGSTLVEGITANGSLYYRSTAGYNYDAAYTSLSHGWSSAPTQALSFYVAGLSVVGWGTWKFAPQPGDLSSVQAGFTLPLGEFAVSWEVGGETLGGLSFEASVTVPQGLEGSIELPWSCQTVRVNGDEWQGGSCRGASGPITVSAKGCK